VSKRRREVVPDGANQSFISLQIYPPFPYIISLAATEICRAEIEYCVRPPIGFWGGNQGDLYMHGLPVNTIMGTEIRLYGKK
jgi:hypothetical protein